MSNINFIPEMPLTWLTCPVYAEGVLLPKRDKSKPDVYSDGKVPYGKAWRLKLNVNDSALMIEKQPETYKTKKKKTICFKKEPNILEKKKSRHRCTIGLTIPFPGESTIRKV